MFGFIPMHSVTSFWIFLGIFSEIMTVSETTVLDLPPLKVSVGNSVAFKWTSDTKILEATWGIRSGSSPNPQYVYVDDSETPIINPVLPNDLKSRLHYTGDLTAGRAWFNISNANTNDSDTYIALIREQGSTTKSYFVGLIVEHVSTTTKEPSTPTAGNCSGLTCTPTPTPTPTPSGSTTPSPNDTTTITPTTTEPSVWGAGQIAGVVVGAFAGAVVIVIIFIVVWKHYKKGQQDNPPTEKKQDTEMKTSTAAKA